MIIKVLVLDGRSRAALAIVRSLGEKHYKVIVAESFKSIAFYSKYAYKTFVYPPPEKNTELFFEFIIALCQKEKIECVIPVRDHTTEILSKFQAYIPPEIKLLVPKYDSFIVARDKAETIKLARNLNIPHPKTILPGELEVSINCIKKEIDLPLVLKPRISTGSRGIQVVSHWHEFVNKYDCIKKKYGEPLIQEFIPYGGGYGVSTLLHNKRLKAIFAYRRLREYPPSGGPGTLRESIKYPEIEKHAMLLLSALDWDGVAMVEFRLDSRDRVPKLMEINPRFWGSLQTAIKAGVDYPHLLIKSINGEHFEPILNYQLGVKVRWLLFGDILWFLTSKKTITNIKAFFKFKAENQSYDILSLNDPLPALRMIYESILSLFSISKLTHVFFRGWSDDN